MSPTNIKTIIIKAYNYADWQKFPATLRNMSSKQKTKKTKKANNDYIIILLTIFGLPKSEPAGRSLVRKVSHFHLTAQIKHFALTMNENLTNNYNNNNNNHKNYNFLACDWFKKGLFSTNSLAKLLSDSLLLDSLLLDSLLSDSSKSQSHSKM